MFLYFLVRKWRHKSALGAAGQWQTEVGEPSVATIASFDSEVIRENCSNVSFLKFPYLTDLFLFLLIQKCNNCEMICVFTACVLA